MSNNVIKKEWRFNFDFSVASGETYGRFFKGLNDKKIIGNICNNRTFYPPKPFCDKTLKPPDAWLECDGAGIVEAFTICCEKSNGVKFSKTDKKPDVPYVLGVIKIKDSEHCIIHFISGFETKDVSEIADKIEIGMKVKPVWATKREGEILDIEYFEPVI